MKKIKVLIVDDHEMIRDGVCTMLKYECDQYTFITEEAENGKNAIAKIKKSHYDVVLMDYQMPNLNGAETTQKILTFKPNIPVLILSSYNESVTIRNCIKAGAKGYILKNTDSKGLIKGIISVLNKKSYFTNGLVLRPNEKNALKSQLTLSGNKISEKEIHILKLLDEGYTSRNIAERLFLSTHAIDKHRKQLLRKFQINNTASLLSQAKKLKIID